MKSNFKAAEKFVEFGLKEKANGYRESASGPGSYLVNSSEISNLIIDTVDKHNIQSILDLGCGDWNWMESTIGRIRKNNCFSKLLYIGWDAQQGLIDKLNKQHKDTITFFHKKDIVTEQYPNVDLIICRDVLFHMDNKVISSVLDRVKNSKANYFISTTYNSNENNHELKLNNNIDGWFFRPININLSPFNMGEHMINEIEEKNCSHKSIKRYCVFYNISC